MSESPKRALDRRGILSIVIVIGLGLLLVLLVGVPIGSTEGESVQPSEVLEIETAPREGALAPDFALFDLSGEEVRLSDLRGQPILINFWATWCGPCRIEMPAIQSRFEAYEQQGLKVLAVDFAEPANDVIEFRDEFGLSFTILLDPEAEVQNLYRNRSYPTSFFVDGEGVIQVQHIGPMTEGQLDINLVEIGLGA